MVKYNNVTATICPDPIRITTNDVYVATNIENVTDDVNGLAINLYKFDMIVYTKDEYMIKQRKDIEKIAAALGINLNK